MQSLVQWDTFLGWWRWILAKKCSFWKCDEEEDTRPDSVQELSRLAPDYSTDLKEIHVVYQYLRKIHVSWYIICFSKSSALMYCLCQQNPPFCRHPQSLRTIIGCDINRPRRLRAVTLGNLRAHCANKFRVTLQVVNGKWCKLAFYTWFVFSIFPLSFLNFINNSLMHIRLFKMELS